jgi:hypothetical protein
MWEKGACLPCEITFAIEKMTVEGALVVTNDENV